MCDLVSDASANQAPNTFKMYQPQASTAGPNASYPRPSGVGGIEGPPMQPNAVLLQPRALPSMVFQPPTPAVQARMPSPPQSMQPGAALIIPNSPVVSGGNTPTIGAEPQGTTTPNTAAILTPAPGSDGGAQANPKQERKRVVRKVTKSPEKADRVLYCLTLKNPIRRLCIGIVEWKYPFQ